ncbi:hypothetical protein D3C79_927460 [compost metagenome]
MTVALAAQVARQLVFALRRLGRGGDVPAQFTGSVAPVQLAAGQQAEQHGRLAPGQAEDEVAGGGYLVELLPMQRAPDVQVEFRVGSHRIAEELLVANDQRLQGGGQIGRQR